MLLNPNQLNWTVKLLEWKLVFQEGGRRVGELKLVSLFGNSHIVNFKGHRYIIHPEILGKNRFRIYNSSNDRQLAIVKFNFWKSESIMEYQFMKYQLKSAFLGVFGTYWKVKDQRRYLSFSNQIFSGTVIESIPNEEMYHLFVLAAIQSMFIYSLLLLLTISVVLFVLF